MNEEQAPLAREIGEFAERASRALKSGDEVCLEDWSEVVVVEDPGDSPSLEVKLRLQLELGGADRGLVPVRTPVATPFPMAGRAIEGGEE